MKKRIALLSLVLAFSIGAAVKHHVIAHGGPIPPTCPPSGCTGSGNSGK